jgi:hypothetical protein
MNMLAVPYLDDSSVVLVDVATELKSEDEGNAVEVIIWAAHAEIAPVGQDMVVQLGIRGWRTTVGSITERACSFHNSLSSPLQQVQRLPKPAVGQYRIS